MATNPPILVRLRPVTVAYLEQLSRIGAYGKGRSGVMRRFIEAGIARAIEQRVINKLDATQFGEADNEDEA